MSSFASQPRPPALRSHVCIYKCTSEFCNRNTAKGVAKVKALRFEVVLPDLRGYIALHINPRYEKGCAHVMYNTYQKGTWDSEQSTPDSPIVKDKLFAIEIPVTKEAYKVPPYKKELINGLKPDKNIVIYGIPNPDCKRYGVAFHYQCRFEENAVVCNTHDNGSWGPEEKSEGIPFIQGQFFQAKISCNAEQYDVSVNGQQAHTYKHRFTKLEDIDVVEVCGDLQLFSVEA